MIKYRIILLLITSLTLNTLVSCNGGKKAEAEEEEVLPENIVELREDQIRLANVEFGKIETKLMSSTLKVNGVVTVSPQSLATVCMPLGGFVKSIPLTPGANVRKGQTLAVIENQDFIDIQQNYLEAKNKLEVSEAEFKRHNELYKNDVYSQKNMQQVTADYKNLEAEVKAMEEKLSMIGINPAKLNEGNISSTVNLASPISGYIKAVNVNIGKFVASSDVLFEVVNSDKLLLELSFFEKDADKISVGQKIHFTINNETEEHEAAIYQTGKSVNNDRTFSAFANVTTPCKNMFPGMYVNAVTETSGNEVTALPSEAIVNFDEKDYIFVFERDKEEDGRPFTEYRMVEVQKGVSSDGYTEVKLPEGFNIDASKVVVKGAYNLLSAKKNAGEMAC